MLRFLKNRWTLILALCISMACGSYRWSAADGDLPVDGGGDPAPTVGGDPDVPGGSGMPVASRGTMPPKRLIIQKRAVGDAHAQRSDVMWRLILILKGLRTYWFRF
jgi:hypothetical protein